MNQPISSTPHVVLVGLMGTGKSTVGRRLAHKLGWEFLDTDDEINRVTGKTVRQIFESVGEEAFRELEHDDLVAALQHSSPQIIAGTGSIIFRADRDGALALFVGANRNGLLWPTFSSAIGSILCLSVSLDLLPSLPMNTEWRKKYVPPRCRAMSCQGQCQAAWGFLECS